MSSQRESMEDMITFDDFFELLSSVTGSGGREEVEAQDLAEGETEEVDPKVMEFLRILDEYRGKCEEEGNYLEAERSQRQLDALRVQEERRQKKAVRSRQLAERHEVQSAHRNQLEEFNVSWEKYMEDYDNMAQMYIQQMTERHATNLLEFQAQMRKELGEKPPKWSRELLEWRRRQHMLVLSSKKNSRYIQFIV